MEGGGCVVGGWTETKRTKTRETRLCMPFASHTTYTCQLSGKLAKDYCATYFKL